LKLIKDCAKVSKRLKQLGKGILMGDYKEFL
jgi:hypothetical protein